MAAQGLPCFSRRSGQAYGEFLDILVADTATPKPRKNFSKTGCG